jgi:hypothetical protein
MQVGDESRKYFLHLLRQLDGLARRVENQVHRRVRIEAKKFGRTLDDKDVASRRERTLRELLRLDRRIITFPYGDEWVLKEYDASTGRFRWSPNGHPAAGPPLPPGDQPPKQPDDDAPQNA